MNNIFDKLLVVEKEAEEFGFKWSNLEQIIQQIISECDEIKQASLNKSDYSHMQEEIGDLIHASMSLCIFCGFDTQETFNNSILKFQERFEKVKLLTKQKGLSNLVDQPFYMLMRLWDEAKLKNN